MTRVLHGYFRSSAAYRVRIALNLKGLDYEPVSVHLRKGEQRAEAFLALNPQGMVPALVDGDAVLTQSPAILEYLDEAYPDTPRLLPGLPVDRARVRALAAAVACDIHPINNLRVLKYVQGPLGCSQDAMVAWYNHWIAEGFGALERMLADDPRTGRFCHGDAPGLADVCLVPQVVNSQRHALDLAPYPTIRRIAEACDALPAFQAAHPSRQPDAE
ncbi:MAG: maleylacetoacetate isomerase [Thalassobaculum sp.]|uniref:maleylacetoacetate isomerase n=1 Tax=Thalassobaculum sp. TaxID=2022740 RepID=UPI0032EE96FA